MIRELQIQYLSIIIIFIHSLSCEDNIIETDNTKEYGVVINEINYNSSDSFNPDDWVELYNNSNDTIDITSWLLKDEKDDHIFIIPSAYLKLSITLVSVVRLPLIPLSSWSISMGIVAYAFICPFR